MFVSQREIFPAPALNMASENVIQTAVRQTETRGPWLTADWNSVEKFELSDKISYQCMLLHVGTCCYMLLACDFRIKFSVCWFLVMYIPW